MSDSSALPQLNDSHPTPQSHTTPSNRGNRPPRGRHNNKFPRRADKHQQHQHHTNAPPNTTNNNTTTTTTSTTNNEPDTKHSDSSSEEEEEGDVCLICCEPIKEYAVGQCNHRDLCAMCTLKRRDLYKENNCCICKTPLPTVIYTNDPSKPFEDFVLHSFIFDTKRNSHFEDEQLYKRVIKLWEFKCPVCSLVPFPNFDQLKKHIKKEHKLFYCELCVADRKVFFAEQQVYTHNELMKHMVEWDGGISGTGAEPSKDSTRWKGHPMCEFCSRHFYGMDHLYKHLQENHFTCHVCEKAGTLYQYYKDYPELERHFTVEHFPCSHPDCLAQKFVYFGNIIDLKAHQLTHNKKATRTDRQLDLNFTYLRAGRNGEGVDDPLERPYRQRTRRREAGYDSDPEDQPAASSRKSKKLLTNSANGVRTDDGAIGSNTTTSENTNGNNNTTTRARAPQSFAPGFRNRAEVVNTNQENDANDKETKELETIREKERLAKEQENQEREEKEREREERIKEQNKQLVKDLKLAIGDTAYAALRESSGEFRTGTISAREYYTALYGFLRHHPQLLIKLIALLPDESKKVALERVHGEFILWESAYPSLDHEAKPSTSKVLGIKGKGKVAKPAVVAWDIPKKTAIPGYRCNLCGDMIPGSDRDKHEYFHAHGSPFTSLSASPPSSISSNPPKPKQETTTTTTTTTSNASANSSSTSILWAPDSSLLQSNYSNNSFPVLGTDSDNFPSLSSTASSLASMSIGAGTWGKKTQLQSQQDFPSLGGQASSSTYEPPTWVEEYEEPQSKRGGGGKKSKKKGQVLLKFG